MNSLGERLKAARTARGLTQEGLATGIATKGFICQVERNQVRPSLQRLRLLADRLGLPMGYFLEEPPPPDSTYLLKAAELAVKAGEPRRALALLGEIVEDELAADHRANAHRLRGMALCVAGRRSEGLRVLQEAAAIAPGDDPLLSAAIYAEIGAAFGELELFNASVEASLRSLEWLKRLRQPDLDLKARVLTNLANAWYRLGRTAEAARYFEAALAAATDGENLLRMANAHMALGISARALGQHRAAISHCEQALAIHRRLGRERNANQILNNLGDVYYAQGNIDEASRLQEQCLQRGREAKDFVAVTAAASELSRYALAQGDPDQALRLAREARLAAERSANYFYLARAITLQGMAVDTLGRHRAADRLFRKAFEILHARGSVAELAETSAHYSEILQKRGDHDAALRFMRMAYTRDFDELTASMRPPHRRT